jgi:hypothetical protein
MHMHVQLKLDELWGPQTLGSLCLDWVAFSQLAGTREAGEQCQTSSMLLLDLGFSTKPYHLAHCCQVDLATARGRVCNVLGR